MANNIPMLEGVDGAGGYLVPDSYGETLRDTILREAAVGALAKRERVAGKRQKYTVYTGRPVAGFTAEGAKKSVTGAGFSQLSVDIKKITATVIYTEELLEDAVEDPRVLVNADVEGSIADVIDAHALGMAGGVPITTNFNNALSGTTNTVEYDATKPDGLALAVSQAMAKIEAAGGNPSGLILPSDARAHFRDARGPATTSAAATPLYTDGFAQTVTPQMWGLNPQFSTNLSGITGAAGAGKIVGIVGDFSHAIMAMRKDVGVRFTDQATLDVGGTLYHLWQQNEIAAQWETRVGFVTHDLNRMFVAIVNAV
jgi:HK97 family phage major capsid protein